jgi:succinate dehydrogenase/fumarate reductase flavoprotein subunit
MIQSTEKETFQVVEHNVDFCVVGGGMAGMLAAIAAARGGAKVLLMNNRPVLGGNASSEIRMWIRGAHRDNMQETGILEEIALAKYL